MSTSPNSRQIIIMLSEVWSLWQCVGSNGTLCLINVNLALIWTLFWPTKVYNISQTCNKKLWHFYYFLKRLTNIILFLLDETHAAPSAASTYYRRNEKNPILSSLCYSNAPDSWDWFRENNYLSEWDGLTTDHITYGPRHFEVAVLLTGFNSSNSMLMLRALPSHIIGARVVQYTTYILNVDMYVGAHSSPKTSRETK